MNDTFQDLLLLEQFQRDLIQNKENDLKNSSFDEEKSFFNSFYKSEEDLVNKQKTKYFNKLLKEKIKMQAQSNNIGFYINNVKIECEKGRILSSAKDTKERELFKELFVKTPVFYNVNFKNNKENEINKFVKDNDDTVIDNNNNDNPNEGINDKKEQKNQHLNNENSSSDNLQEIYNDNLTTTTDNKLNEVNEVNEISDNNNNEIENDINFDFMNDQNNIFDTNFVENEDNPDANLINNKNIEKNEDDSENNLSKINFSETDFSETDFSKTEEQNNELMKSEDVDSILNEDLGLFFTDNNNFIVDNNVNDNQNTNIENIENVENIENNNDIMNQNLTDLFSNNDNDNENDDVLESPYDKSEQNLSNNENGIEDNYNQEFSENLNNDFNFNFNDENINESILNEISKINAIETETETENDKLNQHNEINNVGDIDNINDVNGENNVNSNENKQSNNIDNLNNDYNLSNEINNNINIDNTLKLEDNQDFNFNKFDNVDSNNDSNDDIVFMNNNNLNDNTNENEQLLSNNNQINNNNDIFNSDVFNEENKNKEETNETIEPEKPKLNFQTKNIDENSFEMLEKLQENKNDYDLFQIEEMINIEPDDTEEVFNLSSGSFEQKEFNIDKENEKLNLIADEIINTSKNDIITNAKIDEKQNVGNNDNNNTKKDLISKSTETKENIDYFATKMQEESDYRRHKRKFIKDIVNIEIKYLDEKIERIENLRLVIFPLTVPSNGEALSTDICAYIEKKEGYSIEYMLPQSKKILEIIGNDYVLIIKGFWEKGKFNSQVMVFPNNRKLETKIETTKIIPDDGDDIGIGHNVLFLDSTTTLHLMPIEKSDGTIPTIGVVIKNIGFGETSGKAEFADPIMVVSGETFKYKVYGFWKGDYFDVVSEFYNPKE